MQLYNPSDIIICDSREKNNKNILEYFDEIGQDYIISKLDAGDYMKFKRYETIIDKKEGLIELSMNLCHAKEHERIVREILRAKKLGCKDFIFLIQDDTIKEFDDVKNWNSSYTKIKGNVLIKAMRTMKQKYGVRFLIVPKKDMAKWILKLLGGN